MKEWLKHIPKMLAGAGLVAAGIYVCGIPVAGPIAGPILISAGLSLFGIGGVAKLVRWSKGEDVLANEKYIIDKIKKPEVPNP
jgi:hypothetical protein